MILTLCIFDFVVFYTALHCPLFSVSPFPRLSFPFITDLIPQSVYKNPVLVSFFESTMLSLARARRRMETKQHVRTHALMHPQPFPSITSTSLRSLSLPVLSPSCSSPSTPLLPLSYPSLLSLPFPSSPSPVHLCYLSI